MEMDVIQYLISIGNKADSFHNLLLPKYVRL